MPGSLTAMTEVKKQNKTEYVKDPWKPDVMQRRYLVLESAGEKLQVTQTCSKGIFFYFFGVAFCYTFPKQSVSRGTSFPI